MLALAMRPFGALAVILNSKQRTFVKENRARDGHQEPAAGLPLPDTNDRAPVLDAGHLQYTSR